MDQIGRRRTSPGRPVTFAITQNFLDHFGLESARDLPGLKELKSAGLLESPLPPGTSAPEETLDVEDQQSELFNEEKAI